MATKRRRRGPLQRIVSIFVVVVLGAILFRSALVPRGPGAKESFAIISGSENQALEPIVIDWGRKNGVEVTMTYSGSVDISHELGAGTETRL